MLQRPKREILENFTENGEEPRGFLPTREAVRAESAEASAPVLRLTGSEEAQPQQSRTESPLVFEDLSEVLGGPECFLDVAEVCFDVRNQLTSFFEQNLRTPVPFGFKHRDLPPVSVEALRDELEERVIRLQLIAAKSELISPELAVAEEAAAALEDFLFELRSFASDGVVGEGAQEGFLAEVLNLSNHLVALGTQASANRFSARIVEEQPLIQQASSDDEVIRIPTEALIAQEMIAQKELEKKVLPAVADWTKRAEEFLRDFVIEHRDRPTATIGLNPSKDIPDPVRTADLKRGLVELSLEAEELYQEIRSDVPSSLNYRSFLHQSVTALGLLRVTMDRRFSSGVIAENEVIGFLRRCAGSRRQIIAGFHELNTIAQAPAVRFGE